MAFWNVYRNGKLIDSVNYDDNCTEWYVKDGLINHDGYPADIVVKRVK